MRLDRVVVDIKRTIERILIAFSNNITVEENLGPSGAPEGYVITSTGPTTIPAWRPQIATVDEDEDEDDGDEVVVIEGPPGPPGEPGPPGDPVDVLAQFDKIVTSEGNVVVSNGNVVYSSGL